MYSESDIDAAVAAGAISAEAAARLRDYVAVSRRAPAVDEESFRLVTGFNDIFVSIAAALLLIAVGWIGSSIGGVLMPAPHDSGLRYGMPGWDASVTVARAGMEAHAAAMGLVGALFVTAASWLLAEYFTRVRRMALPGILLLATYAGGTAFALGATFRLAMPNVDPRGAAMAAMIGGLLTAGATWLHWRRFHVPITIAALTGALVVALVSLAMALVPAIRDAWLWVLLGCGIAMFGFAMWWDMSDLSRTTRRSDVAFWLHLAAAPMIAHPIFNLLGVLQGDPGPVTALVVILLYLLFGVIALAIDRRALLVSSLVYVLVALANLFKQFGAVSLNVALTALVIGSALLMLSAFWHAVRRKVVEALPPELRAKLPDLDRPAYAPLRPA